MARHHDWQGIPLPRGWPRHVRSAMLHVIASGQFGSISSRFTRPRPRSPGGQRRIIHTTPLLSEVVLHFR